MARVDLHVHSKYSGRPSDWFLQKFGTNESYTEPEKIVQRATEQGMDYFTITDHNKLTASLWLVEKYPEQAFTGCEFTVYFPEDRCKIHVLVYDLDLSDFDQLDQFRHNIYEFRDYLKEKKLAYSVAHATYSINQKLTIDHIEKLILLFDVFEGINGSRIKLGNEIWTQALQNLNKEKIYQLVQKHKIEPISDDPWIKGFTGGSDDHSDLYIAATYTEVQANSKEEFIQNLKDKKTMAGGRHNDYRSFVFILYKILYDHSKSDQSGISQSIIDQLSSLIYERKGMSLINWFKTRNMKKKRKKDQESILAHVGELMDELHNRFNESEDDKFKIIFNKIAEIFDDFILLLIKSTGRSLKKGDIFRFIKNAFSFLPGAFLTIPFFSTLTHFYSGRKLINEIEQKFLADKYQRKKKILWFTDTINDLNGVSVTISKIGWLCHKTNRDLKIVSALPEDKLTGQLPPNYVNIPLLTEIKVPHYEDLTFKIPSLLKSIEMLYEYEPDEVYISTPALIGLFGLFFAKLTNVKTTAVYHTDFAEQAEHIVGEQSVVDAIDNGMKWFYSCMDKVAVPTREYIEILENRGYQCKNVAVFKRGMDEEIIETQFAKIKKNPFKKDTGIHLLYAGRISQDKNIDFLIDIYHKVKAVKPLTQLSVIGDGPYLSDLKNKYKKDKQIHFTGRLDRDKLFHYYESADLFVFPSNTDTFGMVVMEAQTFGLPALVTNIGGPREIVIKNQTGFVLSTDDVDPWIQSILYLLNLKENSPEDFSQYRYRSVENIYQNYNWEQVLAEIFEEKPSFFSVPMELQAG
ncbi:MAG: glycosyltransferase [Spirochaetes bacterium]|nr:glycosyltransferase [Spirochaetota bacterium]